MKWQEWDQPHAASLQKLHSTLKSKFSSFEHSSQLPPPFWILRRDGLWFFPPGWPRPPDESDLKKASFSAWPWGGVVSGFHQPLPAAQPVCEDIFAASALPPGEIVLIRPHSWASDGKNQFFQKCDTSCLLSGI